MWVQYLGWERSLEKEMATHSSILFWKIPRTEEPVGLHSPQSRKELGMTEYTHIQSMPYFPEQGLNPCPLYLKFRLLTTGAPGKSPNVLLFTHVKLSQGTQMNKITRQLESCCPLYSQGPGRSPTYIPPSEHRVQPARPPHCPGRVCYMICSCLRVLQHLS